LLVRRGFRGWVTHVGVWPLPGDRWGTIEPVLPVYLEELSMRRIKAVAAVVPRHAATDSAWAKHYPSLVAFLTDTEFDPDDGGGKRELGMVTMWASGGFWHAKMRDPDSGHVCYVAGLSVGELLKAADAACSDPGGSWKPDAGAGGRKRK
jgi:hypothetical protein